MVLGASLAEASTFTAILNDGLLQAGIHVRVRAADRLTPDLNLEGCSAVFLLGLPQGDTTLEPFDHTLRTDLLIARISFQVLCGGQKEQLAQAIRAVRRLAAAPGVSQPSPATPASEKVDDSSRKAWIWSCDKCSDPQCEHRLLTDLLAARDASAGAKFQAK
jgi:hypothetical protein